MADKIAVFNQHVADYENWFVEHEAVFQSEVYALREHFDFLEENIHGIQVGVGTGRFAKALGIKEGIEPSEEMAEVAIKRGIEIMKGRAEDLPYRDLHFDFVLFVTICYLDNFKLALREANRVLKHNGRIIIGFLDKNAPIAKSYAEKKEQSTFYRYAHFYTVDEVEKYVLEAGFKNPYYTQTLFGELDEIESIEYPQPGHGNGSFVIMSASKK